MTLLELLLLLVIAGICGVIGEWIVGFSPGSFAVSIVIGLVGAFLGSWLAQQVGLPPIISTAQLLPETTGQNVIALDIDFDIVYSIIGSIVLLAALTLIRGGGRGRRGRPL